MVHIKDAEKDRRACGATSPEGVLCPLGRSVHCAIDNVNLKVHNTHL